MRKKKASIVLFCFMVFTCLYVTVDISSTEVRTIETNGSIGFTGNNQPIGVPDPTPPGSTSQPPISDIAKSGESFPQTNSIKNPFLFILGICILGCCLIWIMKKKKKTT
jgi:LPXTG-motif cell wall-anchored protein